MPKSRPNSTPTPPNVLPNPSNQACRCPHLIRAAPLRQARIPQTLAAQHPRPQNPSQTPDAEHEKVLPCIGFPAPVTSGTCQR